ncbi:hypothetical protein [Terracidiphilus gabretensis]|nr:hypothetical protein [Terracidiphilus gabretensis]
MTGFPQGGCFDPGGERAVVLSQVPIPRFSLGSWTWGTRPSTR